MTDFKIYLWFLSYERSQNMGFSAKLVKTTDIKMTFQATKNMNNHNKVVNYIIIISKAQYESILIEIAKLS